MITNSPANTTVLAIWLLSASNLVLAMPVSRSSALRDSKDWVRELINARGSVICASRISFIADAIPAASYVSAACTIAAFLLGVHGFNAAVIQLYDFNWNAGCGILRVVGDDDFLEHDLVVLELLGTRTAQHQSDFFQVLTGATGFHQFAAGLVQRFGKSEMAQRCPAGS